MKVTKHLLKSSNLIKGISFFLALSSTAMASDRTQLTPDILSKIQSIKEGNEKVSVYISRRTHALFGRSDGSNTSTRNGEIHLSSGSKSVDVLLRKATRGRIMSIIQTNSADVLHVNFDPNCKDESCMFIFTRYAKCENSDGCDSKFYLSNAPREVPADKSFEFAGITSRNKKVDLTSPTKSHLYLEVKLSELASSSSESRHYRGIDPRSN